MLGYLWLGFWLVFGDHVPRDEWLTAPAAGANRARVVPLRWGTWAGAAGAVSALIVGGGAAIAGSSAANAFTLLLAAARHRRAPARLGDPARRRGWRRVVVMLPSLFAMVDAAPRARPTSSVLVVPFLAWLLVRHRPLRVVADGRVRRRDRHRPRAGLPRLRRDADRRDRVACVVVVGAAWAARAVHAASARPRRTSQARAQQRFVECSTAPPPPRDEDTHGQPGLQPLTDLLAKAAAQRRRRARPCPTAGAAAARSTRSRRRRPTRWAG